MTLSTRPIPPPTTARVGGSRIFPCIPGLRSSRATRTPPTADLSGRSGAFSIAAGPRTSDTGVHARTHSPRSFNTQAASAPRAQSTISARARPRTCHTTRRFPGMARRAYTRTRGSAMGRGQSLPTGGRVGIRGVLIWQATLTGLFLLLAGGGLGLPLPEDLTLLAAGVLAHQHVLRLRDVVAVGFAGVVCADWIIYLAGRRYGRGIVALPMLARLFGAARLDAVRSAVERHGARAVFAARFMLGFRIATFFAAGTFGGPAYRFALAEAAGSAIFVPAMATLGFLFSHPAQILARAVSRVHHWLVLLGLLALALYLGLRAWIGRTGLGGEGPVTPQSPRGGSDARD